MCSALRSEQLLVEAHLLVLLAVLVAALLLALRFRLFGAWQMLVDRLQQLIGETRIPLRQTRF